MKVVGIGVVWLLKILIFIQPFKTMAPKYIGVTPLGSAPYSRILY